MLPGVTVKRNEASKNEISIEGNDVNNVSLSCALINQACRVRGKDIRKFLDGVYVEKKIFVEAEDWALSLYFKLIFLKAMTTPPKKSPTANMDPVTVILYPELENVENN